MQRLNEICLNPLCGKHPEVLGVFFILCDSHMSTSCIERQVSVCERAHTRACTCMCVCVYSLP